MFKIAKKLMGIATSTGKKKLTIDFTFVCVIDGESVDFVKRYYNVLDAVTSLKRLTPELTQYNELQDHTFTDDMNETFKNIFSLFTKDDKNMLLKDDGQLTSDFTVDKVRYADSKGRKMVFDDVGKEFKSPSFLNIGKIVKKAKLAKVEAKAEKANQK